MKFQVWDEKYPFIMGKKIVVKRRETTPRKMIAFLFEFLTFLHILADRFSLCSPQ
jgi:hypothetical protein